VTVVVPGFARWLPPDTPPFERLLVVRALTDVGLVETPPGSNRHPILDGYARRFGSPLGSSWCALALGAWFQDAGARVPPFSVGAVRSWLIMAQARGTFTTEPGIGRYVIYSLAGTGVPDHIGLVSLTTPLVQTIEGNTTFKRQTGDDRNGEGCTVGDIDAAHVLGYGIPEAAA